MNRFVPSNIRIRRASIAIWDIAAWFLATLILTGARYDFILESVQWRASLLYPITASVLTVVVGYGFGLFLPGALRGRLVLRGLPARHHGGVHLPPPRRGLPPVAVLELGLFAAEN